MAEHNAALFDVRQELDTVIQHGETLLMCFKTIRTSQSSDGNLSGHVTVQDTVVSTCQLPLCRTGHVTAVERSVNGRYSQFTIVFLVGWLVGWLVACSFLVVTHQSTNEGRRNLTTVNVSFVAF